jgi:hypothetical protein
MMMNDESILAARHDNPYVVNTSSLVIFGTPMYAKTCPP